MNARALLAHVEARGASLRVERGADGAAVLVVAPRSACVDLLPDLQRFKPALLELLEHAQPQAALPGGSTNTRGATATATGRDLTGHEPDAGKFPRDFDASAAFWRLPERQGGLNRAGQVERGRQGIPARFRRLLELCDRSNGATGEAREVWAVAVCVALLDAGTAPEGEAKAPRSIEPEHKKGGR